MFSPKFLNASLHEHWHLLETNYRVDETRAVEALLEQYNYIARHHDAASVNSFAKGCAFTISAENAANVLGP